MSDGDIPGHMSDAAARWITARDAGVMTEDDEQELVRWLAQDPRHAQAFAQVEAFWSAMGSSQVQTAIRANRQPAGLAVQKPAKRPRQRFAMGLAACLALIVLGMSGDWLTRLRADAMTATGEQSAVTLADGSKVRLNTASAIAVDFSGSARMVRLLRGEAAFTVAPDGDRPFTVLAGEGATTALGTRFIVRMDTGETRVSVTQHQVSVVQQALPQARTIVSEGEVLRYGPEGMSRVQHAEIGSGDAWVRGALVFEDKPLADVVRELNRYHAGYITVLGAELAGRRVSGGFAIADPMKAIDTLEQTLGVRSIRVTDRLVFLRE